MRIVNVVNIISVWRSANIDIRLPYIATGSSMTVLQHVLSVKVYFAIYGEMGVSAEQLVPAFKAFASFSMVPSIDDE